VTTFTVIQDIAQNAAGDRTIVESVSKPGAEILDVSRRSLPMLRDARVARSSA
jgi:manganese/iron transport system substrate-binding protein